jgi:hypothetical protein
MAEKLTMKILAGELKALRAQVKELELQLEQKLETTLEKAVSQLKSRVEARQGRATGSGVDADERQRLIAETAYLKAEKRGFQGGDANQDWKEAEAEIDRLLLQGASKHRETPGKSASRTVASRRKAGTSQ